MIIQTRITLYTRGTILKLSNNGWNSPNRKKIKRNVKWTFYKREATNNQVKNSNDQIKKQNEKKNDEKKRR